MAGSGDSPEFTTTLWGVVRLAGNGDGTQAGQALESLCRRYWYPLYAYSRRKGNGPEAAQDLTQGFFAHLLSHQLLARADENRGKFRSFLLKSFTRFMGDEQDRSRAAIRGGGAEHLSFDAEDAETRYCLETRDDWDPEKIFEHHWAVTLIERALARLETEFKDSGKSKEFIEMQPFLLGESDEATCATLAERLGVKPGAARVALHRLRQRYQKLCREEVAQTVTSPEDLEDELRHLRRVLS
jgi:DNA-directed RNA polymerase specialized sigma24 family protein